LKLNDLIGIKIPNDRLVVFESYKRKKQLQFFVRFLDIQNL